MGLRFPGWLRDRIARRLGVPSIPHALERLKLAGYNPVSIFDVGAYKGAFSIHALSLWPNAVCHCFEVLPTRVKHLQALAHSDGRLRVQPVLLGATEREDVPFRQIETASSVLDEWVNNDHPLAMHPMRTIDQVVAQGAPPPELLKIDVQGYELEVLKGAEQSLRRASAIVAELNLIDIHRGAPSFFDVTSWLNSRDWVPYDICGLTRRPLDRALWQADLLFVPVTSALRANKRYE